MSFDVPNIIETGCRKGGRIGGVSLHGCSSKAQQLLLALDEGYLLTTAPPDLERGVVPLGPPAPAQPLLLGRGVDNSGSTCLSAVALGRRQAFPSSSCPEDHPLNHILFLPEVTPALALG